MSKAQKYFNSYLNRIEPYDSEIFLKKCIEDLEGDISMLRGEDKMSKEHLPKNGENDMFKGSTACNKNKWFLNDNYELLKKLALKNPEQFCKKCMEALKLA